MSKQIQLRRGTAAQHATFVGAVAELTVSTDEKSIRLHDGETPGGAVVIVAGSDTWLRTFAALPDALITGAITRDANGAITAAGVIWPDGRTGVFTALALSVAFPGAVDSYKVTYGTKTATQPAVTRDATSGAAITRPAIVIS